MAEENCMNCGDSFDPEHSHVDNVCDFCIPNNEEDLKQCSVCGSEFFTNELDHFSTCTDCSDL